MLILVDYEMPIHGTGIMFVASLNATLPYGDIPPNPNIAPHIAPRLTDAAYLRAASTLAHMGLIAAPTFAFLRQAQLLSVADAAVIIGVSEATVQAYEAGTTPVTRDAWMTLADRACSLDSRGWNPYLSLCHVDLRPRRIRVVVDKTSAVTPGGNVRTPRCPCP